MNENSKKKGRPRKSNLSKQIKNEVDNNITNITNDSIKKDTCQERDKEKARHFTYVVYPSLEYLERYYKERNEKMEYDGSDGYGQADETCFDELQQTGLAFKISPLHDKDKNPDGTFKKPHFHVIVSWENTTTYKSAKSLCDILHSPLPQVVKSLKGANRYLTHKDNPEKFQYDERDSREFNGFIVEADKSDALRMKRELLNMIIERGIDEYATLSFVVSVEMSQAYFECVSSNTLFFSNICSSMRHGALAQIDTYLRFLQDEKIQELEEYETNQKE